MDWWDIYHTILLLGALQGIILGTNLWRGDFPRKKANRWLAALLFFFAYRLIAEVLHSLDVINFTNWTYHVFLEYNWIYGTLIFFYVNNYIDTNFSLKRTDWVHFLPVGLEFLLSNYVKIQNFYWDGTRESLSWLGAQSYILWMHTPFQIVFSLGLVLFYVFKSHQLLQQYTTDNTKPVQTEDVEWLMLILKIYALFSIVIIGLSVVDYLFFNYAFNPFYHIPAHISLAILTYWLGLQGFARRDAPILTKKQPLVPYDGVKLQSILAQLENAMTENKLYKNPKLTLANLAAHLEVKPHQLTQVLNRNLQKSFSDYINEFRVKEVTQMVNDPAYQHYTLLAVAHESGFNSKASFNRIVKKITGKAPKFLKKDSNI
ncbi:MAG: helix-turn-helix domain-containing protein [Bacteroidota bacterium]